MTSFRVALIEHGRATEWLTSLALLSVALTLAMPGDSFALSTLESFSRAGLEEVEVAVPLAVVGTARVIALYINGAWRRSPYLRMWGAIMGAGIFLAFSAAYAWPTFEHGAPMPLAAGLCFVFAGFDMLAAHRSGADVRLARNLHL